MKAIQNFSYEELIDRLTGQAIMGLGRGNSMKEIVSEIAYLVNFWTTATQSKQKEIKKKREKNKNTSN